jgi:hypothetical protein
VKPPKPKWGSEAEMLAAFTTRAQAQGWRCYGESCGHDVIMVMQSAAEAEWLGIAVGDTVAVEGKLQLSATVLRQAMPAWRRFHFQPGRTRSADFYAVVVPDFTPDAKALAEALGITVWRQMPPRPEYPHHNTTGRLALDDDTRCVGALPLELPAVCVDVAAGCPSPRQVTPWKLEAVRLCLLGQQRALVADDFRLSRVRPRSFLDRRWMQVVSGSGKDVAWRLVDSETRPDRVYPEITAAVLAAEAAK